MEKLTSPPLAEASKTSPIRRLKLAALKESGKAVLDNAVPEKSPK
jgi:hypothetical protein